LIGCFWFGGWGFVVACCGVSCLLGREKEGLGFRPYVFHQVNKHCFVKLGGFWFGCWGFVVAFCVVLCLLGREREGLGFRPYVFH
jgi:hypothetical protein